MDKYAYMITYKDTRTKVQVQFKQLLTVLVLSSTFLMLLWLSLVPLTYALPLPKPFLVPGNPVINPISNTHIASVTTTVFVTYDEPISPSTVSKQTFAVHAMQTGLLTQSYIVTDGIIKLIPPSSFKSGELVQVSATTSTLGKISGQGPNTPIIWQFTTATKNGTGKFSAHPTKPSFGASNSLALALGDLDGDRDLDVVVVNFNSTYSRVYLNNGLGVFTIHPTPMLDFGCQSCQDVALGDIDGDSDLDAITAEVSNRPQTVWLNDGTGIFTRHPISPTFGGGESYAVNLGDLDGDGDLDAVVANAGQPHNTYLNNGNGSFASHPSAPTGACISWGEAK